MFSTEQKRGKANVYLLNETAKIHFDLVDIFYWPERGITLYVTYFDALTSSKTEHSQEMPNILMMERLNRHPTVRTVRATTTMTTTTTLL